MSKHLLRDDDAIKILDALYAAMEKESDETNGKGSKLYYKLEYGFDELCNVTGRDPKEYYMTLYNLEYKL